MPHGYFFNLPPWNRDWPPVPCHAPGFIFRSKNFRATVVPVVLISYRTSVINGHEWYSSSDAEHNIHRSFGTYTNQSH